MEVKKSVLILVLALSFSAFAQNNVVTGKFHEGERSQKGFYVGADYMNLTDVHVKITANGSWGSSSSKSEGGLHLGAAGVRLGYTQTPETGVGFEGGVRILETFNSSEYGDMKLQMIIPEANIKFAVNRFFLGYAGFNTAVWTGSTTANRYKTGLGGQAGLGIRFNKELALNTGYTIMNQTYSETSSEFGSNFNLDLQISGFNSNLTYTF
jgi:hypothetical protein